MSCGDSCLVFRLFPTFGVFAARGGWMLTIGRIFAGDGWRYLWDQVARGGEDYYLLDVGRGESPGRWGGSAAKAELGLSGGVDEEQMRRTFGRLVHPVTEEPLGRPPRSFKPVAERLAAARAAHDRREAARWATREVDLLASGASTDQVDGERNAFRAEADLRWSQREAAIRRGGDRQAVAGLDLTFSPPKSVSVLWAAAPPEGRRLIWAAHHEGITAAMCFVEREAALSRAGFDGVRQVDTTGLVTASFDHRMARSGDVHIHTHTATLNRVRCSDGQWRALDGRAVYRVAAAAGAIYDRVRETALERDLGVRHLLDETSGAREIEGVDPEVRRLFSVRATQIEGRVAQMAAEWADQHGSEPSDWVLTKMAAWARVETRQAKGAPESTADALQRWDAECRAELGRSLAEVWDTATHPGDTMLPQEPPAGDDDLVRSAVAAVDEARSTWTRYDLARQITRQLPPSSGKPAIETLSRVDHLVDTALGSPERFGVITLSAHAMFNTPAELRRVSDDESVYDQHGTTRYSTAAGLACERRLLAAASDTRGRRITQDTVEAVLADLRVDGEQADAGRQVLGSGRRVEAVVGPAGTGKTTTMGAIAKAWANEGGQVMGVSISENASRVLGRQAGIQTVNAAKLIYEHTQRHPSEQRQRWWQRTYAIRPGALVILDEASMASRHTIDQIAAICNPVDAKLLLVGDPAQLDSPDASGAFDLITRRIGAVHLGRVYRFAHPWERTSSLRLRAGDPTVLDQYDRRGRIHSGDQQEAEDASYTATVADMALGRRVFLVADSNQVAARLAGRVRDHRVARHLVDDTRTVNLADGNRAGVGDWVVTRNNDRFNRTPDGQFVANRDNWTVIAITDGGILQAERADTGETVTLEADYVADHVRLAYAHTIHAVQGATGDVAHAIITNRTTRHGAYVALTRGRLENHAYVVTIRPEGADKDGPPADPLAVLTDILTSDEPAHTNAALTFHTDDVERAASLATLYPIWQDLTGRLADRHAHDSLARACGPDLADIAAASPAWPTLTDRLWRIHAAGIDTAAAVAAAADQAPLDDADDVAALLHWRLGPHAAQADRQLGESFTQTTPAGADPISATARQIAEVMDTRVSALAARLEAQPPTWANQLGALPDRPDQRADWRRRAGIVAGYREAFALAHETDPIGPAPAGGRVDAHAWWTRAAAALYYSDTRNMTTLPDEHLEAIIDQAATATTTAPTPVAEQLRSAAHALRQALTDQGLAITANHTDEASRRHHDATALARQVAHLENAQAQREHWDTINARSQARADAARTELDRRRDHRSHRSYRDVDTATLAAWLKDARIRADRATRTTAKYQQWAQEAADRLAHLQHDIHEAETLPPNQAATRHQIQTEQTAATRIRHIENALADTQVGRQSVRGPARQQLAAELAALRQENPQLTTGDATPRWERLLADARAADRQHLDTLRTELRKGRADRTWYTNTAEHLESDAERHAANVTNIKLELGARTSTSAATRQASNSETTPGSQATNEHVHYTARQRLIDAADPPQDVV